MTSWSTPGPCCQHHFCITPETTCWELALSTSHLSTLSTATDPKGTEDPVHREVPGYRQVRARKPPEMARLGVVRCLAAPTLCPHLERVNSLGRKARGPQAAGGNKLQVADGFFFSSNPVLSRQHLVPPELHFISNLELTNVFFLWICFKLC